jgi:protein-L-isoaspartate(D-aspartate) O-methyltransferase
MSLEYNKEKSDKERHLMIKEQIEFRGIKNKALLCALEKIPRHLFVPSEFREYAYSDQALPSYCGQTISQPYIVAKMTELLSLKKTDRVLEIGTGTGYQTAILAELAGEVYTMEIIPELYEIAKANSVIQM